MTQFCFSCLKKLTFLSKKLEEETVTNQQELQIKSSQKWEDKKSSFYNRRNLSETLGQHPYGGRLQEKKEPQTNQSLFLDTSHEDNKQYLQIIRKPGYGNYLCTAPDSFSDSEGSQTRTSEEVRELFCSPERQFLPSPNDLPNTPQKDTTLESLLRLKENFNKCRGDDEEEDLKSLRTDESFLREMNSEGSKGMPQLPRPLLKR